MDYREKYRIVKINNGLAVFFGTLGDFKNSWKSGNKKRQGRQILPLACIDNCLFIFRLLRWQEVELQS